MKRLLTAALLCASCQVFGQQVLENNPPSVKWLELNTPNFRVLFPENFTEQAQRVANSLEHIRSLETQSLGGTLPRRIPVILQNQSSISNGFVSLLPRRTEFYAMPSQDYNFTGTNDWLDMLATHEYRHIVQFQHARRGFNKLFYYMFGATTLAGMAQAAAPDWFWEGDAVATETAFTRSGRGRIPYFALAFKTNLLEGREFNYHKQVLRSYKHHIPDEYVLGFHMVSYLRKRTGDPNIWGKITARSWGVPFIPFAFSNAIKKEAGLYVTDLYREMVKDFQAQWKPYLDTLTVTPFETINGRRNDAYTDYLYPQALPNGDVLALKAGIGDIEQFVILRDGKERRLFTPGFINDSGMLSAVGDRVVWNEFGFDPRWSVRNYSLVKTFEPRRASSRVIGSRKARYGGATLSPDGERVATVRTTTEYQTNLVVLDCEDGRILRVFDNPENHFYSMPRWSSDGKRIVVLKTSREGRTISLVNYDDGTVIDLMEPSDENKGHPVLFGDYVLYNSPITGIDNIFAYHIAEDQIYQITNSRYGALNPSVSPDGRYIYYNEQTRNGLDVVRVPFSPATWRRFMGAEDKVQFYEHLVEQEGAPNVLTKVPNREFPVKKYSKLKGLINPYTWGLTVDTDLTEATLGIASKDILSTMSIDAGYVYDVNERNGAFEAGISYQGWFPIIDLSASLADRTADIGLITFRQIDDDDTVTFQRNVIFDWKEKRLAGGVRIPIIVTNGRFVGNVLFANKVEYTAVSDFQNNVTGDGRLGFPDYIDNGKLISNHFTVDASRLLKRSRRDINSRWGQRVILNLYGTPYGGDFFGNQFSLYALLYFPGLWKHHSFWGYVAHQRTNMRLLNEVSSDQREMYFFRNQVPLPRGQGVSRHERYSGWSANYTFPIWYPDIAIGPLLNLQRLRANLFFDLGYGQSDVTERMSQLWSSTGVELRVDLNMMRFVPQFDIGVRYSRGLSPATSSMELLIGSFRF